MILCRFCSLCVLESWERRVCWTGVRWGETLGGRHTRGGSDLGGRGSCLTREVSTGQGGRWGDVVGGLLSTEEGVDRLRPWRALAPWEVWRGAAEGGVVRPRSWTAQHRVRCGTKGGVDKLRYWTALALREVWRSVKFQGTADCWLNKNSLPSMLSSKNL